MILSLLGSSICAWVFVLTDRIINALLLMTNFISTYGHNKHKASLCLVVHVLRMCSSRNWAESYHSVKINDKLNFSVCYHSDRPIPDFCLLKQELAVYENLTYSAASTTFWKVADIGSELLGKTPITLPSRSSKYL